MTFNFVFADDDGVFGDFTGVGELIAELFIGKDDSSGVFCLSELGCYCYGFAKLVFRNWNNGVVDEGVGGEIK